MSMTRGESNLYNEFGLDNIDINLEPPTEEPARQYYFIAKCREWIKGYRIERGYGKKHKCYKRCKWKSDCYCE